MIQPAGVLVLIRGGWALMKQEAQDCSAFCQDHHQCDPSSWGPCYGSALANDHRVGGGGAARGAELDSVFQSCSRMFSADLFFTLSQVSLY